MPPWSRGRWSAGCGWSKSFTDRAAASKSSQNGGSSNELSAGSIVRDDYRSPANARRKAMPLSSMSQ
jgi:hypothetical protein